MPRIISNNNFAALQAHQLMARDFLRIVARTRDTGESVSVGFYSDVGDITAPVRNPDTGGTSTYDFYGSGTLIEISAIPLTANLKVQSITITMSQIDDLVEQAVREYDCKQARVEVYRGYYNPTTGVLADPAECRFVGFVNEIVIKTPSENEVGSVEFTCVEHTQELLRSNPDTRSDESQKLRHAGDTFFKDVTVVGDWDISWGESSGAVPTEKPKKRGLFGLGNFLGFL